MLTPTEIAAIIAEVEAGTYDLVDALADIAEKQKGEDVRKALYSLAYVLEQEGKAGSTDLKARANIEEVDDRLTAQMASFIAEHAGTVGEETLWTASGNVGYANQTITLSKVCTDYDYIDVYWDSPQQQEVAIRTFAGDDFASGFVLNDSTIEYALGGSVSNEITIAQIRVDATNFGTLTPVDGKNFKVKYAALWAWDGSSASSASATEATSSTFTAGKILKIVGRKIVADAEVADMRIGADGTTYQSAGEALRAQAMVIDDTLENEGEAADAKAVGDELADLKEDLTDLEEQISGGGMGVSDDLKAALLQLAEKIAYIDENGATYYADLYDALYPPIPATSITLSSDTLTFASLNSTQALTATLAPTDTTDTVTWSSSNTSIATVSNTGVVTALAYGSAVITATAGNVSATCSVVVAQATLSSISATYTQSGTVYDTDSLDSLKDDLVVTATWSNNTTSIVADDEYTLSGTLTEGTSTITVTYEGKTDTFDVVVSRELSPSEQWTSGVAYTPTVIQNQYVEKATGKIKGYNGWDWTGYIPCKGASTIVVPPIVEEGSTTGQAPASNAFFAEDYSVVQTAVTVSRTQYTTLTVPANASWLGLSSDRASLADCIALGIKPYA